MIIELPEIDINNRAYWVRDWHWVWEVWARGFVPHYNIEVPGDALGETHVYYLQNTSGNRSQVRIGLGGCPSLGYQSVFVLQNQPTKVGNDSRRWNVTE